MQLIEYRRRLKGDTKTVMAKKMDVNPSTVCLLLNGKMGWTDYYRVKAAEVYGIAPADVDLEVLPEGSSNDSR